MKYKVTEDTENRLLATHISNNPEFENACSIGNASKIMDIVRFEMENNNLHTKGAKKLHNDIFEMTRGKVNISSTVGQDILFFVWNSRLSGTGLAVIS